MVRSPNSRPEPEAHRLFPLRVFQLVLLTLAAKRRVGKVIGFTQPEEFVEQFAIDQPGDLAQIFATALVIGKKDAKRKLPGRRSSRSPCGNECGPRLERISFAAFTIFGTSFNCAIIGAS